MYRRVLRLCRGGLRRLDQRGHETGLAAVRRRLARQLQERLLDAAEGGRRQRRRRPGRHSAVQSVQRHQLQRKRNESLIESASTKSRVKRGFYLSQLRRSRVLLPKHQWDRERSHETGGQPFVSPSVSVSLRKIARKMTDSRFAGNFSAPRALSRRKGIATNV